MSNGKLYRSNIDNLALLPKGSSYEWVCTFSGHYMIIEFESNIIYNKKIKNDELANISGMSTVYFRKLFREVIGISPIAYVHEVRIKKAKDMLRSDYGNITDIALSLGYSDVHDFSSVFKKIVGVSPSKYQ